VDLIAVLKKWDVLLVFAAVLLEQSGLPVPSAAVLVVSGSLAATGAMRPELVLLSAFLAALLADHLWFFFGRRFGRKLLATVCRVSLSPDTCVRRTDDLITTHGAHLLIVAKFIPGVSAVAVPTAAATGIPYRRFILFDILGCLLWSGAYVGAGVIFSREIERVLDALGWAGGGLAAVVAALFALYVGAKFLHRFRLQRLHRLVRISPDEVLRLLDTDPALLILDARTGLARNDDPRELPRSIVVRDDTALESLPHDARSRTLVTFCTCPSEASAALLAEKLIDAGYTRVRVLTGGMEAIERLSAHTSRAFIAQPSR
jgi:membrane protein DedA with SNARE-associated domain/rhodanese-related sulfurtransferase